MVTTVFERPFKALLGSFHRGLVYLANLEGQADAKCWNSPRYLPVADDAFGFKLLSRLATHMAFLAPPGTDHSLTAHTMILFILCRIDSPARGGR